MDVLILGATGLCGTAVTNEALARGHRVVAVHRGGSNTLAERTDDQLTQVVHDRSAGHAVLQSVHGPFDAVIDVAARLPAHVIDAVRELDTPSTHWVQYSSISVYADLTHPRIREDANLATFDDGDLELAVMTDPHHPLNYKWYAPAKAACERLLVDAVGAERALIMRPALITGAHDDTMRAPYWVERLARGGDALAPPADSPVQIVDARDLAQWALDAVEQRIAGTFTTAPPSGSATFSDLIAACERAAPALTHGEKLANVHHVSAEQLSEHEVENWSDLPAWIEPDGWVGMVTADTTAAHAAGYRTRPLDETMAWVAQGLAAQAASAEGDAQPPTSGIDPERERVVLASVLATS